MIGRERARRLRVTFWVYLLWIAGYEAVGRHAATLPALDLSLPLDAQIPFVPEWVFVYQLAYFLPFGAAFAIVDGVRFDRAVRAIGLAAVTGWAVYLALPVTFAKPVLGASPAERLLALEHGLASGAANHLPSLHVANAFILYFAVRGQRLGRAGDALALGLALAISASTLLVKQHIVLDVVGGVLLALLAWSLAVARRRARALRGDARRVA